MERLRETPVIPVFGWHRIFTKKLVATYAALPSESTFPNLFHWSNSTIKRVQQLKPAVLAIDSLPANVEIPADYLWSLSPGSPFELRKGNKDFMFVGADILPFMELYEDLLSPFSVTSLKKYWQRHSTLGDSIQATALKTLVNELYTRPDLVPALSGIIWSTLLNSHPDNPYLQMARYISQVANIMFLRYVPQALYPLLFDRLPFGFDFKTELLLAFSYLAQPLVKIKTSSIAFRNAIVSQKTVDAKEFLGIDDDQRTAALFGSGHLKPPITVWTVTHTREKVLRREIRKMFQLFTQSVPYPDGYPVPAQILTQFTNDLIQYLATIRVWRVMDPPEQVTQETLTSHIPVEANLVSLMINRIIADTAEETVTRQLS